MFLRLKQKRALKKDGSLVDSKFLLFINNCEPMTFSTRADLSKYLRNFRNETDIFKLQIFRVETYSL